MNSKQFSILYLVLLALEIAVVGFDGPIYLRLFTKSALCVSLLIFLMLRYRGLLWIKIGVFFSLTGDLFLLFTDKASIFFIIGLLSFLIAHLSYIAYFFRIDYLKRPRSILILGILLGYGGLIFYLIAPGVGPLLPYVIAYMLVLLFLVLVAGIRAGKTTVWSFRLLFLGVMLFLISDSMLALDRFYRPSAQSGIWIMLTYGLAQLGIVMGSVSEAGIIKKGSK